MAERPPRERSGDRRPKEGKEPRGERGESSGRTSRAGGDERREKRAPEGAAPTTGGGTREPREKDRDRDRDKDREARREKEAPRQAKPPADDPEAWLDCQIADINDAGAAPAPPGGREGTRPDKIPKRPSSRQGKVPKGEQEAGGHREDKENRERPRPPSGKKADENGKPDSSGLKEVPGKATETSKQDDIDQESFKDYAKTTAKSLAKGHDSVAQAVYSFMKKALAAPSLEKPVKSHFAPFEFKAKGSQDEIERIVVDLTIKKTGGTFHVAYKSRVSILAPEANIQQQPAPPKPPAAKEPAKQQIPAQAAPPVAAPAPAAAVKAERPKQELRPENIVTPQRKLRDDYVEGPSINEEIETHVNVPKTKVVEEDDIDEEVEYDDDFEEAAGDEEEEYKPRVSSASPEPRPSPSPEAMAAASRVVRPESMQGARSRGMSPSPAAAEDPNAMMDIMKAMEKEKQKAQLKARSANRDPASANVSHAQGFLGDYKSTMPQFNLGTGGTAKEKAAQQRIKDLKKLGITNKRTVESIDLFSQRPSGQHSLFLAGKSLRYCNVKTAGCQTGEDDMDVGTNTEEVFMEDKEQQFPTLTMSSSKASGEQSQMLAFLRRTLPLFEASMAEAARREGPNAMAQEQAASSASTSVSTQATISLPPSFVQRCIGANICTTDIAICPEWYGADHALLLYNWPWRHRPYPDGGTQLDAFTRPLQSVIGLYPLLSTSSSSGAGAHQARPARCLFAFCRLSSLTVVAGRSHFILAGSEMGSLMVWDLRNKPHGPGESRRGASSDESAARDPDEDIAHFEGPVWLDSAFSTDSFAFAGQFGGRDELDEETPAAARGKSTEVMVGGAHSCEICCVRCSDVVGGDALIVALDVAGTVSFWRLLELQDGTGQSTNIKLASQGSISLAGGGGPSRSIADSFLDSRYVCIHPQQQAQFVVLSAGGMRQCDRQRTSSVANGPNILSLKAGYDEMLEDEEGQEMTPLRGGLAQPVYAAFNPFFSGLLLVAYAEGDLALFDCTLCVPVTQWADGARPGRPLSVAWSTVRPCVFFVKAGGILDVWDLSEKGYAPVLQVDIAAVLGAEGDADGGSICSELYVSSTGQPVVGHGVGALVLQLPISLTTPLQVAPPQYARGVVPVDSLLRSGCEKASLFPTLERYRRDVEVPGYSSFECEIMRTILSSIHPMQAW